MKIGIIEICEPNHYTAVEALAKTYTFSADHQVYIFTLAEMRKYFKFESDHIQLVTKNKEESIYDFLCRANEFGLDRIHINTLSKYHSAFSQINWKTKILLTIHNADIWFNDSMLRRLSILKNQLSKINEGAFKVKSKIYLPIKYFFKGFKLEKFRSKIIGKPNLFKVLVYSENQKSYLNEFISADKVIVFPFCIHEKSDDTSEKNDKFRICITGSVDNNRRDYTMLFSLLAKNIDTFKNKICIDLLGYIPKQERYLIPSITKLQKLGIQIIYNEDFIGEQDYDERLNKCDIILGNLRETINQSKYGQTKETGVIFNMIKAGKPGIFPSFYSLPKDLEVISLVYTDNLKDILLELMVKRGKLNELKEKAKVLVKKYEPSNLYDGLING